MKVRTVLEGLNLPPPLIGIELMYLTKMGGGGVISQFLRGLCVRANIVLCRVVGSYLNLVGQPVTKEAQSG